MCILSYWPLYINEYACTNACILVWAESVWMKCVFSLKSTKQNAINKFIDLNLQRILFKKNCFSNKPISIPYFPPSELWENVSFFILSRFFFYFLNVITLIEWSDAEWIVIGLTSLDGIIYWYLYRFWFSLCYRFLYFLAILLAIQTKKTHVKSNTEFSHE